jgi:sec-independent protein translocase protein TatA
MLAFIPGGVSPMEMMILGLIALLLFGKKLPEVARGLGKSMVEFKRGIRGLEDEVKGASNFSSSSRSYSESSRRRPDPVEEESQEWTAPRFEPPTSAPVPSDDKPASSTNA